jgi:carbohydrate-selective porin OprB
VLDLEEGIGWPGARILVSAHAAAGQALPAEFGFQGLSNIDADPFVALQQVYVEQSVGPFVARAGQLDAAELYGGSEYAAGYMNPSMGFGPCLYGLPTWPEPQPGVSAQVSAGPASLSAGAFLTGGQGAAASQLEARWAQDQAGAGRVAVGGWGATTLDAGAAWIVADQALPSIGEIELGVWTIGAIATPTADQARMHVGAGVVAQNLLPTRDADTLGLGASWVHLSDTTEETVLEGFYTMGVTPALSFTTDVQHVIGGPTAGTVRVAVSI